ncbi:MAG: murein biosynthesis integral membrane protein MurJ [Candidatus Nanopelagicus sp.]
MSDSQLLRASSVMAAGTIVSRITGLIRNLLIVALLGTAILGDTYNVANTMPNILYNLLIGGALTAVFVPQIVRSLRDSDGGKAFISRLFTLTITSLFLLTLLGVVFSPQLVNIYAPEYAGGVEFDTTVTLMRYCLPQIFFLGLFALLGQIANAKGRFGPMMWAPALNNLIAIGLFSWFLIFKDDLILGQISDIDLFWLGFGTTFGYIAQAVILFPVLRKSGVKLSLRFDWADSQIIKSFKLAGWSFAFALISQLSYLVTISIATSAAVRSLSDGVLTGVGYTPYSNAYLILILPHSIITVSVVTALLPQISNYVIDKKFDLVTDSLAKTIKLVGVFTVPSAVILFAFGPLVANVLYFGISTQDANYLGLVLSAFAFGLIPVSVNLVLMRGLNAFENLKSQVIVNFIMNAISVVLSLLAADYLEPKWVTVGLAGIFTLHYFIGVAISLFFIKRHGINLPLGGLMLFYVKLLLIFALIVTPLWLFRDSLPGGNLIQLITVTSLSVVLYLGISKLFKITEVTSLIKVIRSGR